MECLIGGKQKVRGRCYSIYYYYWNQSPMPHPNISPVSRYDQGPGNVWREKTNMDFVRCTFLYMHIHSWMHVCVCTYLGIDLCMQPLCLSVKYESKYLTPNKCNVQKKVPNMCVALRKQVICLFLSYFMPFSLCYLCAA